MKPRIYKYVAGKTTHASSRGAATTWANTWHVTCFGFLVNHFFLFFFLYTRYRAAPSPVDRFGRSSLTSKILKPAYKATASIPAKLCSTVKTTKCSSSLVQIHTQQFQDGGRPPFWKTVKLPYLSNRSTDFEEFWHSDATGERSLKFRIFKNRRWRQPPSWKSQKARYLSNGLIDLHAIWHDDAKWVSYRPDR